MSDIIDILFTFRWHIAGTLIMAVIGFYLTGLHNRKNRLADASIKFRSEIMNALENIYPTISVYIKPEEINNKIRDSIPRIVTAANVFSHHLPYYRKGGFDRATKNYSDTARNTDWNSHIAYLMFPSMQKPGDISPGDKFKHAIDNLLSYAKEK